MVICKGVPFRLCSYFPGIVTLREGGVVHGGKNGLPVYLSACVWVSNGSPSINNNVMGFFPAGSEDGEGRCVVAFLLSMAPLNY